MIWRVLAIVPMCWVLGFLWFGLTLPEPVGLSKSDAVVVATGSSGRIQRGLELLEKGQAPRLLVSGVSPEVKPHEFMAEYGVSQRLMNCCVTLGFEAEDTRGNASETAAWVEKNNITSLRLVTADWHMRRAGLELGRALPDDVEVIRDAVASRPSLETLFIEYNKLVASFLAPLVGN